VRLRLLLFYSDRRQVGVAGASGERFLVVQVSAAVLESSRFAFLIVLVSAQEVVVSGELVQLCRSEELVPSEASPQLMQAFPFGFEPLRLTLGLLCWL